MAKKTIKCSMCGKPLAIFWVTRPSEKDPSTGEALRSRVQVKCCYCADSSFPVELVGGYAFSGFHLPTSDPDEVIPQTEVEYEDMTDDLVLFKARKV